MKKILFLIICVLLSLQISAQVAVTGHVVDDENKPLAFVIIKCLNTQHKMRGYATSSNNGSFSINAERGDSLTFTMLGFQEVHIAVKGDMKPLTVKMGSGAIELKEVSVKSDKVHERGDTVSYVVGAFANSNDRSIGDVIAKMPGFDVDKSSGKISYEGKPVSKFYIEGLDMLGGKYGAATNTLPQDEVGAVEVMRKHQPIRVLDDFTYTDDAAVNIKMKNSAKSHWVTSWKLAGGYGNNHSDNARGDQGLWAVEGFGLRLKSQFQTMLTYKTNNIGLDISRESTSLFDAESGNQILPQDFILLSSPKASSLNQERSLFNRSHAVTMNMLKKLNEDSQLNFQLVYNNERDNAWGQRNTVYTRNNGNRVIDNSKTLRSNNNDLYALLKYELNSEKSYLRNSLSGNITWLSQRLEEVGTHSHLQHAYLPVYDFRDNLYVVRRFGKSLISFYSYNTFQNRPQYLDVDSLIRQDVAQRYYATDTYGMGGWKLGLFNLSMKMGMKGVLRYLDATASGLPDSLGVLADKSHFSYARLYMSPQVEFSKHGFVFTFSVPFENTYYKYSESDGKNCFSVSPLLNVRWDVTSRFAMGLNGSYHIEPLDYNRFYGSLILQDYLTLNQGYLGYEMIKNKSLRYTILYRNALKGTHLVTSVTRRFTENPYTMTQKFIGDYIAWGTEAQVTKSSSWLCNFNLQQGLSWLGGKIVLRSLFTHNDSKMLQDGDLVNSKYNVLNASGSLLLSPYKDMTMTYSLKYAYSDMKADYSERTSFESWLHEISVIVPLSAFRIHLDGDYYHNQITESKYKDMFLANCTLGYKTKHIDWELKASNIFNKKVYAYTTASNLVTMQSVTAIRGREIMLSINYKP